MLEKIDPGELSITEGLSEEGFEVYRKLRGQLEGAESKQVRQAAQMSAIIAARMADRMAELHRQAGQRKYTALDYIMQRHGEFLEAKGYTDINGAVHDILNNADFIIKEITTDGRERLAIIKDLSPHTSLLMALDYTEDNEGKYYTVVSVMPQSKKQTAELKKKALSFNGSVHPHTATGSGAFFTPTETKAGIEGGSFAGKDNTFTVSLADADKYVNTYTYNGGGKIYSKKVSLNEVAFINADEGQYAPVETESYDQKAWHGTPYNFERFDIGKIGAGVGDQVHGWGLCFAKEGNIIVKMIAVFTKMKLRRFSHKVVGFERRLD